MKIYLLLISIFIFLFSINTNAAITTVYRADGRPPEEVFEKGFTAQGNNTDLVRHVLGLTVGRGGNSAFISTSVNTETPMWFANQALTTREFYYVYNIRPTDNFYFTSNAIYTLYGYLNEHVPSEMRYSMSLEAEYSALSYIASSQIRSVTAYTRNSSGQTVVAYTRDNPNYIEANTHPNDGDSIPRQWVTTIPNQGPLQVSNEGNITPAYQVPEDLSDEYRYWTFGCFGFASGFFK